MASFHKTIIVGNIGRDPEQRYLPTGDAVCNFSVAVSEKWKGKDGTQQESTIWYRVNAFGKLAEVCGEYLRKGSSVLIEGRMQTRKWEKDGVERESWELRADSMQMLGGRGSSEQSDSAPEQRQTNPSGSPAPRSVDNLDDDTPFVYDAGLYVVESRLARRLRRYG